MKMPSEADIRKATTEEVLQNSPSLLPAAACILCLIYLIIFSPIFGLALPALVLAVICALIAVFFFNRLYGQEYPRQARRLLERYHEISHRQEEGELERAVERVRAGFGSLGGRGQETFKGLLMEYAQNKVTLARIRAIEPLSVSLIPALVEETFRRGIGLLEHLLELQGILRYPGTRLLEKEMAELENEIAALSSDPLQSERLKYKQESLELDTRQMERLARIRQSADQVLYQARRCQDCLQNSRLELSALEAGSLKGRVNSVIESLHGTINQVKEVQNELEKLGY